MLRNNQAYLSRTLTSPEEKPELKLNAYCINQSRKHDHYDFICNEWSNFLNIRRFEALNSATDSHIFLLCQIWKNMAEEDFPVVIMEDDVYRRRGFTSYWNVIPEITDCDYISFDATFLKLNENQTNIHQKFCALSEHRMAGFNVYFEQFFLRFKSCEDLVQNLLHSYRHPDFPDSSTIDIAFTHNPQFICWTPKEQVCRQIVDKLSTTENRQTSEYVRFYNKAEQLLDEKYGNKVNDSVTVVTVTYNAADILEETIRSVIEQSWNSIEYIIIDGGSSDGTVDIIKKYEDYIDYWVSEADQGIYFAMNKAIEMATGKWINFMNAGDIFSSNEIVEYVMCHKSENADLVYGNCEIGSRIKKPHEGSVYTNTASLCHQALFVRTALMKETPFDTKYRISADHDFILKMFQRKHTFHYIDRAIAKYLLEGVSDTHILRLRIEGLAVLMANDIPDDEIIQSPWYLNLVNDIKTEETQRRINVEKQIKEQERNLQANQKRLFGLLGAIKRVTDYPVSSHPFKKYCSYKNMLRKYWAIKSSMQK